MPTKRNLLFRFGATQCWSNAGPPAATLAQHQASTGSTPRVCWDVRADLLVVTADSEYKPTPLQRRRY